MSGESHSLRLMLPIFGDDCIIRYPDRPTRAYIEEGKGHVSEEGMDHDRLGGNKAIDTELHAGETAAGRDRKQGADAKQRTFDKEGDEQRRDIVIHAGYEVFVAGFLIVQLVNSTLFFLPLMSEQRHIVRQFWIGISVFILIDVLIRLLRVRNKRRYLFTYFGWLTLLGSMPVPFITSLRLLATGIMLRKLRRGELQEIGRVIVSQHAQSTVLLIIFVAALFFEFGSLLVLAAEANAPGATITTSADAIWWSVVTISTVGYGDTFPTTYPGRLIGAALILSGVGLFTSITSLTARWFLRPRKAQKQKLVATQAPAGAQAQIQEIRSLLAHLEDNHRTTVEELEDRLSRLESLVAERDGDSAAGG
jgi:voltage-gated potassium channel